MKLCTTVKKQIFSLFDLFEETFFVEILFELIFTFVHFFKLFFFFG